jgi:hypothetical protein
MDMETKLSFLKPGISIFLFCIILCSCSSPRYVYTPPAQNVPVFTQKGDSKLGAYYSMSPGGENDNPEDSYKDNVNGLDLQAAYAISDQFAVQASYAGRSEKTEGSLSTSSIPGPLIKYDRKTYEGGIGYYKALNVKKSVYFQVFAGFGAGRFNFTDNGYSDISTTYSRYHNARVNKYFLQPAFILLNNGFSMAFTTRATVIKYGGIKTNYSPAELDSYNLVGLSNSPFLLVEPTVTASYQLKKLNGIRFEAQIGTATIVKNLYYDIRHLNFSIGTVFDFGKKIF